MKIIVDEQLPEALASWPRDRNVDADHVFGLGLSECSEREIWTRAELVGADVISRDRDFVPLAASSSRSRLRWLRCGNCDSATLLTIVERGWANAIGALASGERVVEVR